MNLYLRPLTESDATEVYASWLADPAVNRFLEVRHDPPSVDGLRDWIKNGNSDPNRLLFGIGTDSKDLIGTATLHDISFVNGTFGAGWMIGDKNFWGKTSGIQIMFQLFDHGFLSLGLRKFFGRVYAVHAQARLTNKFLGMTEEARLYQSHMFEGMAVDTIVVTMTREEWSRNREQVLAKLRNQPLNQRNA